MKLRTGSEWDNFCEASDALWRLILRRSKIVAAHAAKAFFWFAAFCFAGGILFTYSVPGTRDHIVQLLSHPGINDTISTGWNLSETTGLTWGTAKIGHRLFKAALILLAVLKNWSRL